MRRILVVGVMVAFLAATVGPVYAQGVTETMNNGTGQVNWSDQVVRATGIAVPGGVGGRAGMIRAAEADALRQLLGTIKGMQLSSETTVENFMTTSDVIRTRVQGVVQNYRRVGDPVYMSDGSIEITVEMALSGAGKLYDAVLPPSAGTPPPMNTGPVNQPRTYTGLVVDARGLGLRPAIAPRILSQNGDEVYGSRIVDREWAVKNGMVGYAKDVDQARSNERVAGSPMVVEAVDASGANRTDAVIGSDAASMLHGVSQNYKFLQQCRVIFVVD